MMGTTVCRSHGGRGIAERALIPGYLSLDDEEIATLKKMVEEDDTSLSREFHMLRVLFGRAMEQAQQSCSSSDGDGDNAAIEQVRKLAGIIDRLSAIAERRARISIITPHQEKVFRIAFDDPRAEFHIQEKLREMQDFTIRRILALVIYCADPKGELGLVQRLPKSLAPYLPSGGEVRQSEATNAE